MPKFNLDKALRGLEIVTKAGIFGYSDKIGMGILTSIFKNIDEAKCYEFINKGKYLWDSWGEDRWEIIRRMSKSIKFDVIVTMPNIMQILEKNRPDILTIISFHPQGKRWLESQVEEFHRKVGNGEHADEQEG